MAIWAARCTGQARLPLDYDVADYFGFDKSQILAHVEQLFYPRFEPQVLDEDDDFVIYGDVDG